MIGNKQLEKIICVACTHTFGEHSKRDLIRCIFRIQGTMVSDGIQGEDFEKQVVQVKEKAMEIEDQD